MSTYIVTGGAGFIGSALIRQFIDETDHRVANVDRLKYAGNLESLGPAREHPNHVFHQVDVCDAPAVRAVFESERPNAVIHLAAESHVDRSIDGPGEFIQTNVVGTFMLLQEALRYWRGLDAGLQAAFRFIHVSTDEVFGALGPEGMFTETTPYDPNSPYSASKAGSDHLAGSWHHTYGVPVMVTNRTTSVPIRFPS